MKFLIFYNIKINYIKRAENNRINAFNEKLDYNIKILKNL